MAGILISGATGFVGRSLTETLLIRGRKVRALVRPGSERRVVSGCEIVTGDAFDPAAYRAALSQVDTLVQLVGVSHPSPAKAAQFRAIDQRSAQAAIEAAREAGVAHFVYVSVAHPAPVMKEYIAVRSQMEQAIHAAQLNATILRPWYVLGPGRRWPLLLKPVYWAMALLPSTRESAQRLGLLALQDMVQAIALAVEQPPRGIRVWEVPQIRSMARARKARAVEPARDIRSH